ncbi:MAG TPA: DUF5655 domain-containing protein [Thermoanaerobaculia bacterium]|nr:DUF5655 domain-containing protein [Thermoanaerobaculia bacterium]
MTDIKLFRIEGERVSELQGESATLEKSLQKLIEDHLSEFLGVLLLASEYPTGKTHGGRIDTLGLDENRVPVIIEYKRSLNENVINQGLFYLDWLMDHKAEFKLLVMEKVGKEKADAIVWAGPRLLCIAGDFTRYDSHAVQQMNRNIELIRYRRYGKELLLFELVNATAAEDVEVKATKGTLSGKPPEKASGTVTYYLQKADAELRSLYDALHAFTPTLGDDVQVTTVQMYIAYRRIKNFACVEVHPQSKNLLVFLKVDPDSVELLSGFSRDVRKVGHFGTGDLELRLKNLKDLEAAKPLVLRSYEAS